MKRDFELDLHEYLELGDFERAEQGLIATKEVEKQTVSKSKKSNQLIYQSNVITMGRYEMSAVEKNIMYMLLSQIKPEDTSDTVYTVDVSHMENIVNKSMNIEGLKEATKKLLTRIVEGEDENGDYFQTTFISSATYLTGKGVIALTLAPKVRPYYIRLTRFFTTYQLETALNLTGKHSKRLYEILSMYKNFANPEFRIKVDELKRLLGIVDKQGKDSYPKYPLFRKLVLDKSLNEINNYAHIDIKVEYEEILGVNLGRGRKPVETLLFHIAKTRNEVDEQSEVYLILTQEFQLRKDQTVKIMQQYTEKDIRKRIYDVRLLKNDQHIRNIGAYVAKLFNV